MKKYISLVLIAIVIGGISIFGHTFIKNKEYEFELRDYNTMKQVHDIIENSMQLNSVLKISSQKVSHADLYYLVIYDNGDVVINFTDIQYNVVQGNYTNCVYQFG